jgi:hypothetical protein
MLCGNCSKQEWGWSARAETQPAAAKEEVFRMPEPEDDLVELPYEIHEITQEEAEAQPDRRADPSKAPEGILDDQDPARFQELELEGAEAVILGEVEVEEQEGVGA